jgi:hypothetical protein
MDGPCITMPRNVFRTIGKALERFSHKLIYRGASVPADLGSASCTSRLSTQESPALARAVLMACGCLLITSCATGSEACRTNPNTGIEECQVVSNDYSQAAATAIAAGALWTVEGCTVNGCKPPYTCNAKTKLCERIRCGEDFGSCPGSFYCDPVKRVCL